MKHKAASSNLCKRKKRSFDSVSEDQLATLPAQERMSSLSPVVDTNNVGAPLIDLTGFPVHKATSPTDLTSPRDLQSVSHHGPAMQNQQQIEQTNEAFADLALS